MPSLTAPEIAVIRQRLTEAKAALHNLQIGQSAVEIRDSNGDAVRYTPANASRLKAYIAELEAQLLNDAAASRRVRRPMVPTWG
jgi:hypothetical protein